MPILRTPNLHLIVIGCPLELSHGGAQHEGQPKRKGIQVTLGLLKEVHLMQVGKFALLGVMRVTCVALLRLDLLVSLFLAVSLPAPSSGRRQPHHWWRPRARRPGRPAG
jgi:hypothetical protein